MVYKDSFLREEGRNEKSHIAIGGLNHRISPSSCTLLVGEDGKINGKMTPYSPYYIYELAEDYYGASGFLETVYEDEYQSVTAGSHAFYFKLYYYTTYPTYMYMTYWQSLEYTVTANKGTLFSDGKDKNFTLYLDWYDYDTFGLKVVGQDGTSTVEPDGTLVFTNDELTVKATIKKIDKLPEGAVPMLLQKK